MDRRRIQQLPRQINPAVAYLVDPPAIALPPLFFDTFNDFIVREDYLLRAEVSERTICARLAMMLEHRAHELGLTDYRADVEYNRMQDGMPKCIRGANLGRPISITCDIVLHGRGIEQGRENLIAIEIKKWDDDPDLCDADRNRLELLTGDWRRDDQNGWPEYVAGYRYGFFIVLRARTNRAQQWLRALQRDADGAEHPHYDHGYIETFSEGQRVGHPHWFQTILPAERLR